MLIFPIQKAMAEKRRLFAVLDDKVDGADEALDYAASVPVFKAWSATANTLSGGKSWGNVRQQHNLRSSAGIVVSEPVYDDVTKTISFEIDVDDDQAWDRVLKGQYCGISPGGKGRRYTDGDGIRRVAMTQMFEISLVDLPCSLNAGVTIVKAAGDEEQVQASGLDDLLDLETSASVTKALAAAAEDGSRAVTALLLPMAAEDIAKAFGRIAPEVSPMQSYAERLSLAQVGDAMPDGSWPILTQADLDAAGDAVVKAAGVADDVRVHLAQRATELSLLLPPALRGSEMPVAKGMGSVAEFAQLITDLRWLAEWVASEAQSEGDGSQVPARLLAWLRTGALILSDMAAEEAAEAVADLQSYMQSLPMLADVVSDDIAKALGAARSQSNLLVQVTGRMASLTDELRAANARAAAALAEVDVLKAQPSSAGPAVFAVMREADGRGGGAAKSDPEVDAVKAMADGPAKASKVYALQMQGRWKE